jgi:hypothetical protein
LVAAEIAFAKAGKHHCDRVGCKRLGTEPGKYLSQNFAGPYWVETWFCREHVLEEVRR